MKWKKTKANPQIHMFDIETKSIEVSASLSCGGCQQQRPFAPGLLGRLSTSRLAATRMTRPAIAGRVFWAEYVWLALESSGHEYALLVPLRRIGWDLQCTGSGAELLGFEALFLFV